MRILWFVSTLEDTNFLKEFSKSFDGDIDVFFLNFITYVDLYSFTGKKILPIYEKAYDLCEVGSYVENSFNVLSGRLSVKDARRAYCLTYCKLQDYLNTIELSELIVMLPSGRHVHHLAARKVCKDRRVRTLYINYSNFPGYTFFDPSGTDCLASIYENPEILNLIFKNAIENINIEQVFKKFSDMKKLQKQIPQKSMSPSSERVKKIVFLLDRVVQYFFDAVSDRKEKFISINSHGEIELSICNEFGNGFIFFPLQVSTDQQILVNYKGGSIFKAIDEAYSYAKSKSCNLVVREHPAEKNKKFVREYLNNLSANSDFFVSNLSVAELIERSEEVVTVNSTVGLETRLNKKTVYFLGESFYQKLTDLQLALYLDNYLVPVDYHKPNINSEVVSRILGLSNAIDC